MAFSLSPSSFLFISGCGATGWREADANSKREEEVDLNKPTAAVNLWTTNHQQNKKAKV
jgi:hypothetical protein